MKSRCPLRHVFRGFGVMPLSLCVLGLSWQHPVLAEGAVPLETVKGLHPYATVAVAYDSNLLRRPHAELVILRDLYGGESDIYATLEAGFATAIDYSRQQVVIGGRVYHVSYDRFNQLDHTGGDARILWNWVRGSLWEGDLGYTFVRKQRDFANEVIPTNDMLDRNRAYATAKRWITTRWRLGGQAEVVATSFDKSEDLNRTLLGVGAMLDYVSAAGSVIGINAVYSDGQYWNQPDRDYTQASIGPSGEWSPTLKTHVKGNIAYETFKHDERPERDFDGLVGRVKATWRVTGKTSVATTLSRAYSNLEDESANFAIVDSLSFEPAWNITSKTTLRALASFQRQDYQSLQSANIASELDARVDDIISLGLWVDWQLRSNVSVSLGYAAGSRESTHELKEYDFQNVQAIFTIGL